MGRSPKCPRLRLVGAAGVAEAAGGVAGEEAEVAVRAVKNLQVHIGKKSAPCVCRSQIANLPARCRSSPRVTVYVSPRRLRLRRPSLTVGSMSKNSNVDIAATELLT